MAPAKRRRRRAGDDVRAARASFVIIAGEPNPSPPLQHVEEQLFFVRGGFFTCAASRSKFSNIQRRSAAPSRRLWAGPFCSSRRPSRSASHESGREGWKRAGRVGRLAAHCVTRRGGVSAACARAFAAFWLQGVFCVFFRVRTLVLQAAWRAWRGAALFGFGGVSDAQAVF